MDGYLQAGMAQGQDAYERNWCALQRARLLITAHGDKNAINAILSQTTQKGDGTMVLREEDQALLNELLGLLAKMP